MTKSPEERGPIGAWLVSERNQRGWMSAETARKALERARVFRVAQSVYAEWEAGTKRPNTEQLEALTRFYGSEPKVDPMTGGEVAAAIREQTAALVALLEAANRRAYVAEQRLDAIETVLLNMTNRPGVDPRDVAEAEAARERLVGSESSHPQRRLTDAGRAQQ